MAKYLVALAAFFILLTMSGLYAQEDKSPLARFPCLSPDGGEIAFTYQGDIWKVATSGGTAMRLTDHVAYEAYPKWSPDGKWIAFAARRWGGYDIYIVPADGGEPKRLTFHHYSDYPECWSPDSRSVYFRSSRYGSYDLYRVGLEGGTPVRLTSSYWDSEYFYDISPDGNKIAFCRRGRTGGYRRKQYKGSNNSDIWIANLGNPLSGYKQLTEENVNEYWPLWSSDGNTIYYVSHSSGCPNLWKKSVKTGERKQLTDYSDTGVYWPTMSADGSIMVFEHDFYLYSYKPGEKPRKIIIDAVPDTKYNETVVEKLNSGIDEYELSPDGKKIAFTLRGEVWLIPAEDGTEARRLTNTSTEHWSVRWAPDSEKISYTRRNGDNIDIIVNVIPENREYQLASTEKMEGEAMWSPDGKSVVYCVDDKEIWVCDSDGKNPRKLAEGGFRRLTWRGGETYRVSPDSQWLAYRSTDDEFRSFIFIVPLDGGEPKKICEFPSCYLPRWSADGKLLYFIAEEHENYNIYKLPLQHEELKFAEDKIDKLFKKKEEKKPKEDKEEKPKKEEGEEKPEKKDEKTEKEKKLEVEINFKNIEERVERVTSTSSSEGSALLTPDGKTWVFTSDMYKGRQIWTLPAEDDKPGALKQLTSSGDSKGNLQLTPDGKNVFFESRGRIFSMSLASGRAKNVPFQVEIRSDLPITWKHVFNQAHWLIEKGFYDPELHGADWEEVYDRYSKVLDRISTSEQFDDLIEFMLGELNASHLGYYASPKENYNVSIDTGWLGVEFDQKEIEAGKFKIVHVYGETPADNPHSKLEIGEYILKVNGTALDSTTNIFRLLEETVGKKVELEVSKSPESAESRQVYIKPTNYRTISGARYREWRDSRREIVHEMSGGQLGYVHVPAMSGGTLDRFRRELASEAADKLGLVIDVRYNGGGSTAVHMLEMLYRKPWLYRGFRDFEPKISENLYRSNAFEKPTISLINERSFSNAEIWAEGYSRLGLGTLVGLPTAGGCIGTSSVKLVDGSSMRLPAVGAWTIEGENLDFCGRAPDVRVDNSPEDVAEGVDVQLRTATKLLMEQILEKDRSDK